MNNERVLIVGGGVAGFMAKNRLESLGYQPILCEKSEELRAHGSGLLLGPNVVRIFREIGLEEELVARAQKLDAIHSQDSKGIDIGHIDLKKIARERGLATVAIHRQAFHDILSRSVDCETIWLGHKLIDLTKESSHYKVTFEHGRVEKFDRIIAADGLFSKVRDLTLGSMPFRHFDHVCWRFVIGTPDGLDATQSFEMWGNRRRVGVFPIGGGKTYVFLVASMDGAGASGLSQEEVLGLFDSFEGVWRIICPNVDSSTVLHCAELVDAATVTLQKDGIVFIGDAGHSTTPNMGQGAAMGIESAYHFGELLGAHSFDEAVMKYGANRYKKVTIIRERSMLLGKMAHLPFKPLQALRNLVMRLAPQGVLQRQFEELILCE